MEPALTEALAALRVLSDPTRTFGANKARGMQAFAAAARVRAFQLHEPMCATCGEEPATATGRCERCNLSLQEEREAA